MKKLHFTVALTVALLLALFTNTTFSEPASLYSDEYWSKDNEIRILYGIGLFNYTPEEEATSIDYTETEEQLELYSSIQENVVKFFWDIYGIDVKEKISKMTVHYFYRYDPYDLFAGYTVKGSEGINLNIDLVTSPDFSPYLPSTYLHETMHYLGVISNVLSPIDEGFAEYLSLRCAEYCNMEYFSVDSYAFCLSAASEMCVVNEENIIRNYLKNENFDISEHVSKVLENVPQLYNEVEDIGSVLSTLVGNLGVSYDDQAYVLAFIAQDILNAYCREFHPSKEEIDVIRSYYFVKEIEITKVEVTEDGFTLY